jgi:Zn-dependent protease with chaperone function
MRAIVVTRGLLGDYDASEAAPKPDLHDTALTAILAHELHHWDCDVVGLTIVRACFYPVAFVVNAIGWIRQRGEWLAIALWCMFWPAWVCTKLVVVPLLTRRSRQYGYEADVRAASLVDEFRPGLRRALDSCRRGSDYAPAGKMYSPRRIHPSSIACNCWRRRRYPRLLQRMALLPLKLLVALLLRVAALTAATNRSPPMVSIGLSRMRRDALH